VIKDDQEGVDVVFCMHGRGGSTRHTYGSLFSVPLPGLHGKQTCLLTSTMASVSGAWSASPGSVGYGFLVRASNGKGIGTRVRVVWSDADP
jgi:hypothetical protein